MPESTPFVKFTQGSITTPGLLMGAYKKVTPWCDPTRIGNILTINRLKEYLRMLVPMFFDILGFCREKISLLETFIFRIIFTPVQIQLLLKSHQIDWKNFAG